MSPLLPRRPRVYDVAVLGAGSAGAAAAWQLARRGLRVALVERRPAFEAGARWVNAIPAWMFEQAEVPLPGAQELRGRDEDICFVGGRPDRVLARGRNDSLLVDMRHLVARLQHLAGGAGVNLLDRCRAVDVELDPTGRPRALMIQHRDRRGPERCQALEARLFVDASGTSGFLRGRVPALRAVCPPLGPGEICLATQQVARVVSPEGAAAFLRRLGAAPGAFLAWTGVAGGFSTLCVSVRQGLEEVELLAGLVDGGEHGRRDASSLLAELRAREPWIGEAIFGGEGRIPLRRPYDGFVAPGVALLGNAACQVFSVHASSVGASLVAGRYLAEAVAQARNGDPGSLASLWPYLSAYQRDLGATQGAYDLFRRMSQGLQGGDLDRLVESGLLTPRSLSEGHDQRLPSLDPRGLLATAAAVPRAPGLALHALRALARMPAVWALYRRFPEEPSPRRLRAFQEAVAAASGLLSDPRRAARSSRQSAPVAPRQP